VRCGRSACKMTEPRLQGRQGDRRQEARVPPWRSSPTRSPRLSSSPSTPSWLTSSSRARASPALLPRRQHRGHARQDHQGRVQG
jgi:hypothetical protein